MIVFPKPGEPPSPVPESVAALLLAHPAHRSNTNTGTNLASRRLFPGRRAGRPLGRTTYPRT
ncbi:hypothetical protein [Embleya scabrispora]|uniref:hypothetical protein n=1 Tax=Embleya scabrispora TaxID=159449 RepID=UPI00117D6235|nr:hypothetical protein [Embleya scabrispora]